MGILKNLRARWLRSKYKHQILTKNAGQERLKVLDNFTNDVATLIEEKDHMRPFFTLMMSLWTTYSEIWAERGPELLPESSFTDVAFRCTLCHLGGNYFSEEKIDQSIPLKEVSYVINQIWSKYPDSREVLNVDEISTMIENAYNALFSEDDPSKAALGIGELAVGKNPIAALYVSTMLPRMIMSMDEQLPRVYIHK